MTVNKSRISRITIGRLHYLGNYEHIRYELTVEIPEGQSAAVALRAVENILNRVNPKRPSGVYSVEELKLKEGQLHLMRSMSAEEFTKRYGEVHQGRQHYIARCAAELKQALKRRAQWEKSQKKSRALLDDLGGAEKFVDCKAYWNDEEF